MNTAEEIFLNSLDWLKNSYDNFHFYLERDLVWTLQCHLTQLVEQSKVPIRVYNDYPIIKKERRSLCADIALVSTKTNQVELLAEFKYEPSHQRDDILPTKFPVVFWGKDGVGKDVERVRDFVMNEGASCGYSIFVDEGGAFRHRDPHPDSEWQSWGKDRWILKANF